MNQRTFRIGLGVALIATLAATWFSPPPDEEAVVAPVASHAPAKTGTTPIPAPDGQVDVLEIRPRAAGGGKGQDDALFAAVLPEVQSGRVAAAPATAAVATVPAAAPAAPFRVLGRFADAQRNVVFLEQRDKNLVVAVGDTIDGQYKVEGISTTTLTLRYLPMDQVQTISLGGIQ